MDGLKPPDIMDSTGSTNFLGRVSSAGNADMADFLNVSVWLSLLCYCIQQFSERFYSLGNVKRRNKFWLSLS